jgi:FkbM family methyltransferase
MPIIETVRRALQRVGLDVLRFDPNRYPELRRALLLRSRRINVVLDIGANEGHYAEEVLRAGYEGRIVSFEPLSSARCELERRAAAAPTWETRPFALGDTARIASFHIAGNSSSSSLLPMTARHVASAPESAYVADEQVDVRRLDDVAPDVISAGDRVWLKLDVQGFELPVLLGAERTLEQVEIVETELSLVELYEGQSLLGDMVAHLAARGFGTWFFEPVLRDPASGELLQVDGVFGRRR